MDIAMAASTSLSSEISVAASKPILRGIHHLALVTDNMRMTLDFYVRVLGMPSSGRAAHLALRASVESRAITCRPTG